MIARRHFIKSTAALFGAAVLPQAGYARDDQWGNWDAQVTPAAFDLYNSNPWGIHPRFMPQLVEANPGLTPGDIHVDPVARYLYQVRDDGLALRFGVAIAKGNLYEPGIYTIKRKARWPSWTPTAEMIAREPEVYAQYADGMPGGPDNPLGSRALYLYDGPRDTYLRIHGTNEPWTIGGRASSGCVRMIMAHINTLYPTVERGVRAHLHGTTPLQSA